MTITSSSRALSATTPPSRYIIAHKSRHPQRLWHHLPCPQLITPMQRQQHLWSCDLPLVVTCLVPLGSAQTLRVNHVATSFTGCFLTLNSLPNAIYTAAAWFPHVSIIWLHDRISHTASYQQTLTYSAFCGMKRLFYPVDLPIALLISALSASPIYAPNASVTRPSPLRIQPPLLGVLPAISHTLTAISPLTPWQSA